MYVDCNNLYGFAMSQALGYKNYKWCSVSEVAELKNNLSHYISSDTVGYMFQVDLGYPEHLHDFHDPLPLCPENLTITQDMLSPYSKKLLSELYGKTKLSEKKLVSTLGDKNDYVCLGENLLFYLECGMELKAIKRVLKYEKTNLIAAHIQSITQMRMEADSELEKMFFKLIVIESLTTNFRSIHFLENFCRIMKSLQM